MMGGEYIIKHRQDYHNTFTKKCHSITFLFSINVSSFSLKH